MDPTALRVTLLLATATTLVTTLLGLPLAYWLARTSFRGRFLIEALVSLPIVLPPTVVGFYLLLLISPVHPLGGSYRQWTGRTLPFTFEGILIASVIYNLPFAVRPFVAGFAAVDRRLLEAAWCLGATPWKTFWQVAVPLAWPGIVAGMILTFAHTVGEFGVVLMVGGSIPSVTRTLSLSIYDDVQALNYAAAHRTSLALLIFSFVVLAATYALTRRRDLL